MQMERNDVIQALTNITTEMAKVDAKEEGSPTEQAFVQLLSFRAHKIRLEEQMRQCDENIVRLSVIIADEICAR